MANNYTKEQIQAVAMSLGVPQSVFDGKGGAENYLKQRGLWDTFQTRLQQPFTPYAGGTQDMFVAPLSQMQEQAVTSLGNPVTAGNPYFDQAGQYLSNANDLIGKATAAPTADEFNQWYGTFKNPYQQDVFDATMGAINDAGSQARSRISAAQARLGRTGDTATALQMAELDKNIAKQVAETGANLNYSGFNTASSMAQNQMQNNRGNILNALSSALGLSTNTANLGTTLRSNAIADIENKLKAGGIVQQQDQNYLNAARNEFGAQNGYSGDQLTQMMELLKGIQGYTTGGQSTASSSPNMASRIGNLLSVGGQYMSTPTVNNLPWTTPGNVNPQGGYYY